MLHITEHVLKRFICSLLVLSRTSTLKTVLEKQIKETKFTIEKADEEKINIKTINVGLFRVKKALLYCD